MSIDKIVNLSELKILLKNKNFSLVHGVFDVFHIGHKRHIEYARNFANTTVVSITSDKFVNKGPGRPFFNQKYRSELLSSLDFVDYVIINDCETSVNLINELKPNFYIKGNDYKIYKNDKTGNILKEIKAVKRHGGQIVFSNEVQFSSSKLINESFKGSSVIKDIKKNIKDLNSFRIQCEKSLEKISKFKVAVIGEMIFDKYIVSSNLDKPSKENIQAVEEKQTFQYLGGTFAIAKNISEFCKNVDIYVAGDFSNFQLNEMRKSSIKSNNLKLNIYKSNYHTITKSRFINVNYKKLFESYSKLGSDKNLNSKKIIKDINKKFQYYDVVLMADFGHGFFSNDSLKKTIFRKSKFLCLNVQTNADNRGFNLVTKYSNADYVLTDTPEIRLALSDRYNLLSKLSADLYKKIKYKYLGITLGKDGVYFTKYNQKNSNSYQLNGFEVNPVDTMGAGDAVFGISSLLLKTNANLKVVCFFSNLFGAIKTNIIGHSKSITKNQITKYLSYLLK